MKLNILVANLGRYNEGCLVGEWLELPATQEQINSCLSRIGIDGVRYEEFFISDYESNFIEVDEFADLYELNNLAWQISELSEEEQTAVSGYVHCFGNIAEALDIVAKGEFEVIPSTTVEEYADQLADDMLAGAGELIKLYFDFEAFKRDFKINNRYNEVGNDLVIYNW